MRQRVSIRSSKFLALLLYMLASAAVAQRDKPLATAYVECLRDAKGRDIASRSVRTPTLSDLFAPLAQNFAALDDPCDVLNINQGSATRAMADLAFAPIRCSKKTERDWRPVCLHMCRRQRRCVISSTRSSCRPRMRRGCASGVPSDTASATTHGRVMQR